ncbi:hypothetical protein KEM55_006340 [Ascosphaera atra]|nr:hypothetical protein KEM55_006340 [Ascosphaera atra]
MRKRKMIVKHVLDTPYVYTFIDDPEGCRKRVETNKSLNRKKALVMTAGKQYLQQQFASPNSNGDNGDCEIIFDGPNKRSQRSSSSASKPATKPKSDTMTSSPPTDRRQSTNSRRQPSALGSPFSTPHAPMKRETFFTGLGMPMRNPQLSRFDSSPAYPYGSSLSTDYTFSPDHQQTSTPGSSLPGSYGAAGFDHCLMGGMHMGVPHSHMSTPLISQDGFHTPSTQRPHGLGFPSMAYSRNGTDTSTVSPPSLFTNAGAHENNGYAAMMSNGGANFPPQMSSPKKRAIGNSVVTASEADHPSQKRMMNNS